MQHTPRFVNFIEMKIRVSILFLLLSFMDIRADAQFKDVLIGISGLTCSQCSRSVEMSLRKLDFVQNVEMGLQKAEATVTFKPGRKVDVEKIAKAVKDAGFSVRLLDATFNFDNVTTTPGSCFVYKGDAYQFRSVNKEVLNGAHTIRFIGDKYLDKKISKKMQLATTKDCTAASGKVYAIAVGPFSNDQAK